MEKLLGLRRTNLNRTRKERGASMVEYALIVAIIVLMLIAAIMWLGQKVTEKYEDIDAAMQMGAGDGNPQGF